MEECPGYHHPQALFQFPEYNSGNIGALGDDSIGQDALSAVSAVGSLDALLGNLEASSTQRNHVNYGGDPVGGTGIKIRTRQSQPQQTPESFVTQGIAPRRTRLQMHEVMDSSSNAEQEAQSNNKNHVNDDGDPVGGTGIKIRTRQRQPPQIPESFATQGIASRRIRLQMPKVMDASNNEEKETQSILTAVSSY